MLALSAISPGIARAQQSPPIAPKTTEAPLPPSVELPPPPEAPADVPNRPLTPDEAVLIALRRHPSVALARAGIATVQGKEQQQQSGLRPSVSFSGGYNRADSLFSSAKSVSGGSAPGYSVAANVKQLLFDFNHTRDLVRQATAQERGASENLTRTQSDLVYQVKQAFYTCVQNQRLVGVNENNLRSQQKHLALALARLQAGIGLPLDVVRAETALAEATLNLTLARNNAANARVSLALFMGVDPRTPVQTAEASGVAVSTDDLTTLVEKALARRPEVLQSEANLQAAQFGVNAAKTSNAPSVSASLGMSTRGDNFPPHSDSFSVGAILSWSPFDAGLTEGRIQEAAANAESMQAQLENTRQGIIAEVSQAYLNLKSAEQRIKTAEAGITNAEESVRLADGRYLAGVGIFLDVIDAQTALLTARTNHINAQSALDQASTAIARAIGAPLPAPQEQ